MNASAILSRLSIQLRNTTPGNHKAVCPKCSHTRRNKRDPCLSVKIDHESVVFHCFNCPWKGAEFDQTSRPPHAKPSRNPSSERDRGGDVGASWRRQLRSSRW